MVTRCVVWGCRSSNLDGVSACQYSKDATLKKEDNAFVRFTRKDWRTGTGTLSRVMPTLKPLGMVTSLTGIFIKQDTRGSWLVVEAFSIVR